MNEFGRAAGDWDLQAIVKGPKTMPTSYACNCFGNSFSLGLELCKPFHQEIIPTNFPPKIVENDAVTGVCTDCAKFPSTIEVQKKKSAMSVSNAHSRATSSRRRRNKHKISMVYHAAGEPLLSDKWNWRKYGEKAIKGSPYPRSYYRCSNSGGCLARKQVEQSNTDPGIFLITYIDEHNHPFPTRRHTQAGLNLRRSSTASPKLLTTNDSIDMSTPIIEDPVPAQLGNTKDDASVDVIGEVGRISDMAYEDDFFAGLEYLERLEMDLISDQIIPFDPFP